GEGGPGRGAGADAGVVPGRGDLVRVVVVGAGKMGLPLACQFARQGAAVTACDVNPEVVRAINASECPFDEPGLPELLREGVAAGRLRATTETAAAVAGSDVVVVIVPAVLTPERDVATRGPE